jgi:hypothetical protein
MFVRRAVFLKERKAVVKQLINTKMSKAAVKKTKVFFDKSEHYRAVNQAHEIAKVQG